MDEPRTISKRAYNRLVLLLATGMVIAVNLVVIFLARAFQVRIHPFVMGGLNGLAIVYTMLAKALVERFLRRFDLTRSGKAVEIHARSPFGLYEEVEIGDVVEARAPQSLIVFLLVGAPIFILFFFAASRLFPEGSWMRWLMLGMAAFFLICFIENILDYGKPIAWVDADGATGYPSHRALWRKFVPWSDIFSCEVETRYDTFGKPILLRPILKGRHGETLMKLYLIYTPMIEQERVVKYIKTKLPETELEPGLM